MNNTERVVGPDCCAAVNPVCWGLVFFPGNHILPDEDLAAFHWSLLGPEHPLASLKVSLRLLSCSKAQ